jgi:hypothetical protein
MARKTNGQKNYWPERLRQRLLERLLERQVEAPPDTVPGSPLVNL